MGATARPRFRFRRVLFLLLGIYALLALAVFIWSDKLVFYPNIGRSTDWSLPSNAEEVWLESAGEPKLHAWFMQSPGADLTVLYCHGNGGDLAGLKPMYDQLRAHKVNVFAFDYRGYGKSGGSPSEAGIYRDGLAAYDWLVANGGVRPQQIVVLGHSLGTTVATYVAAKRPCRGLILESPLASARAMASKIIPFPPLGWASRLRLDNEGRVKSIRCPILIVHGTSDTVIPIEHGRRVFEAANEPKKLVEVPGGGHNDLWSRGSSAYEQALAEFLRRLRHNSASRGGVGGEQEANSASEQQPARAR